MEMKPPSYDNEEWIKQVDAKYYSPNERTKKVWSLIVPHIAEQGYNDWDMTCFCVGYLTKLLPALPMLEEEILKLAKTVYVMHYANIDRMLEPDKIQRDGIVLGKE